MKWLVSILAVLLMVSPAVAGEDPYLAVVGNDFGASDFYNSPKYLQFAYDQEAIGVPVCETSFPPTNIYTRVGLAGCEQFRSMSALIQPEVCDTLGYGSGIHGSAPPFEFRGEKNARVAKQNSGFFEWYVRLPKKPSSELNLVLQCGVLKPDTFTFWGFNAVQDCAAETGERIGTGICTRDDVDPGVNPLVVGALPMITAIAYPGQFNVPFAPFHLTAYRNPGTYNPFSGDVLVNGAAGQVLNGPDGGAGTRILLKSCMDKAVIAKIPVTGQVNALSESEVDLEAGDLIYVRLDIPRQNTVDIYCHSQSFKLMGIGESPF